jgi:biotin carboxyl carrier protein
MTLELLLRAGAAGGEVACVLSSPTVGVFTRALPEGAVVTPGAGAGVLLVLGRAHELVVPAGATGRVISARPDRVHAPVGYGDVLYELAAFAGAASAAGGARAAADPSVGLGVRAPYAGRFWSRPAPGDPPFVAPGDALAAGAIVGMLEVMKTFTQVLYDPSALALPERARVVRVPFADGAEVKTGDLLIEVEPRSAPA